MTREEYIKTMANNKTMEYTVVSTGEIAFESEPEGTKITGMMYSSDEMFNDAYGYYAEVLTDDALYTCYYKIEDGQELDDIDYSRPWAIVKTDFDEE